MERSVVMVEVLRKSDQRSKCTKECGGGRHSTADGKNELMDGMMKRSSQGGKEGLMTSGIRCYLTCSFQNLVSGISCEFCLGPTQQSQSQRHIFIIQETISGVINYWVEGDVTGRQTQTPSSVTYGYGHLSAF